MFAKFLNLKPEKQQSIINAAMKEFAQKGFDNASTNEIVKAANISKGLLFHYFNNKKDLYLFLYDYSLEIFSNEFFGKIDWNEKDIFIRLRQMAILKGEIIKKYPGMFDFTFSANIESSSEVKDDLERRNKKLIEESYRKLFEGIDISKFKKDIEINRAVNIIIWTTEGFANREQKKMESDPLYQFDYDKILAEFDVYIELLRRCFYK